VPSIRLRPVLAALAVTALIVAGCAHSDKPTPETSTEAPTTHGAYAHCLAENGVTEAPGPLPGPAPGPANDAAQACASLAPGPAS